MSVGKRKCQEEEIEINLEKHKLSLYGHGNLSVRTDNFSLQKKEGHTVIDY